MKFLANISNKYLEELSIKILIAKVPKYRKKKFSLMNLITLYLQRKFLKFVCSHSKHNSKCFQFKHVFPT